MSVRCKFRLDTVTTTASNGTTLEFNPVSAGSDENKAFFKYTPCGQLKFQTVNEEAVKDLKVGGEYYIDITSAAK